MAKYTAYHFQGLPSLRARDPDNAAKRAYGPKCYAVPIGEGMYEVREDTEYYGTYTVGYMACE